MSWKKWTYYLLDKDFRSMYVDDNGNVQSQTTPKPMNNTPDGWQNLNVKLERNNNYFGIVTTITSTWTFVKDGARILRKIFFTEKAMQREES